MSHAAVSTENWLNWPKYLSSFVFKTMTWLWLFTPWSISAHVWALQFENLWSDLLCWYCSFLSLQYLTVGFIMYCQFWWHTRMIWCLRVSEVSCHTHTHTHTHTLTLINTLSPKWEGLIHSGFLHSEVYAPVCVQDLVSCSRSPSEPGRSNSALWKCRVCS